MPKVTKCKIMTTCLRFSRVMCTKKYVTSRTIYSSVSWNHQFSSFDQLQFFKYTIPQRPLKLIVLENMYEIMNIRCGCFWHESDDFYLIL